MRAARGLGSAACWLRAKPCRTRCGMMTVQCSNLRTPLLMPMADHEKAARRRAARTRRIDLSTALASLSAEELRETVKWLAVPRPRPTRKTEMAVAVEQRLTDASLHEYWNGLDGIEQMAVREVLYGHEHGVDWNQFGAKHGAIPASLAEGLRSLPLPLRFFLYRLQDRYRRHTAVVPAEVARRLLEFVPPPPEAALAVADALPATVERGSGTVTFPRARRRRLTRLSWFGVTWNSLRPGICRRSCA